MFSKIRRILVWIIITPIYCWGCICYDKKYLTGRYFDRFHFTKGWEWILRYSIKQKISGYNKHVPWPVPPYVTISVPKNIIFDPNDMDMFHTVGSFFQGIGATITIGHGCEIAQGTGFITANHDLNDLTKSAEGKDIIIGDNSWIGMNAVILPGVILGPHTIVGANAVVTKSFVDGNCVIAGNPAKIIRKI